MTIELIAFDSPSVNKILSCAEFEFHEKTNNNIVYDIYGTIDLYIGLSKNYYLIN